jgi:hypothetical protein
MAVTDGHSLRVSIVTLADRIEVAGACQTEHSAQVAALETAISELEAHAQRLLTRVCRLLATATTSGAVPQQASRPRRVADARVCPLTT